MLQACATSNKFTDIELPDLPSSVKNAGNLTPWPDKPELTKEEATITLTQCRADLALEVQAVKSAKLYHKELQKLYGAKR